MRRSALLVVLLVGVCLAFGMSTASAPKKPGVTRVAVSPVMDPIPIGPGYGGIGPLRGSPARFVGLTTQKFPIGAGALGVSRACNAEHPVSRLCEWAEIYRALPPITLDSEALVAPNYETNPVPVCITPNGGLNCRTLAQRIPAACCGYPVPTSGPLAALVLTPGDGASLVDCSNTFVFTATALDAQGLPLAGIQVGFEFPPVVGGTVSPGGIFNPAFGLTDENGMVSSTLSFDNTLCTANCAGGHDCHASVGARDLSGLIVSNSVEIIDAIP
jgi:hypothetical protein